MSLQESIAARQRFYEILMSADVVELEAVRVHVGLAALLGASYRFDAGRHVAPETMADRGARSAADSRSSVASGIPPAKEPAQPDWLPDHLHYGYLLQRAPPDLARQLDLASAAVKAQGTVSHLFFGYANLGMDSAQLAELMALMCTMYPKMRAGLRTFPAGPVEPDDAQFAGVGR